MVAAFYSSDDGAATEQYSTPAEAVPLNARQSLSGLFPDSQSRRAFDDWLTGALQEARRRVVAGPVKAVEGTQESASALRGFDFNRERDATDVLSWLIERMEHGVVHVDHPKYFGLFNPTPTFASQCADRVIAAFNPQLASAKTSPFPVALEAHVITQLASRIGMPEISCGHFTSGGSEANATALVCALTHVEPGFAAGGSRAFSGQPTVYVSRDAHLAWLKIAHQTGMGRDAVRLIATDGAGRMEISSLSRQLKVDIEDGCVPVMIAATAGTTGAGMIDPLDDIAQLATIYNVWYHVDAAWGGALAVSAYGKFVLKGIERAHSVTIDAHKWLATTMGCGMFLTSRPAALSSAFHVIMECMPSNDAQLDPYVTSLQWSRRFVGLRLFLGLAIVGWQGYAEHVARSITLANLLERLLQHRGWCRVNASPLAVVCLRPPADALDVRDIARAVVDSGAAWISTVEFEGQCVLRACITSGECSEDDIHRLAEAIHTNSYAA